MRRYSWDEMVRVGGCLKRQPRICPCVLTDPVDGVEKVAVREELDFSTITRADLAEMVRVGGCLKRHPKPEARAEALAQLQALAKCRDPEIAHGEADKILLALIADPEIEAAFDAVEKWYA